MPVNDTWILSTGFNPATLRRDGATVLATYRGWTAYEHPTRGDEAPILAVDESEHPGRVYHTGAYDLECFEEEVDDAEERHRTRFETRFGTD